MFDTVASFFRHPFALGALAVVILVLALSLLYTYMDYRKHRKPLVDADPQAEQTYTYQHHVKTVTVPLLKYRVQISVNRKPTGISKF